MKILIAQSTNWLISTPKINYGNATTNLFSNFTSKYHGFKYKIGFKCFNLSLGWQTNKYFRGQFLSILVIPPNSLEVSVFFFLSSVLPSAWYWYELLVVLCAFKFMSRSENCRVLFPALWVLAPLLCLIKKVLSKEKTKWLIMSKIKGYLIKVDP